MLPAPLLECLEPLVGLSRTDCPCYEELPASTPLFDLVRTSTSGLYVDEAEGFNASLLLRDSGCGPGSRWDKLVFARRAALRDIVRDISVGMNSKYAPSVNRNILIGEQGYQGPISYSIPAGTLSYLWQSKNFPGGVMTLTHIGFLARVIRQSAVAPEVTIHIRRLGEAKDLASYTIYVLSIDVGSNQPDTSLYALPEETRLPADGSVYEFYYEYDPTIFVPFDNRMRCVVCTSGMAEFDNFFARSLSGSAYGIMWSVNFSCDMQYLACAFSKHPVMSMLLADMIQALTIEKWISLLLATQEIGTTSDSVLDNNQLPVIRDTFAAMALSRATSLYNQADSLAGDIGCFACRQDFNGGRVPTIQGNHNPIDMDYNNGLYVRRALPPLPR